MNCSWMRAVAAALTLAAACNQPTYQNRALSSWVHDLGSEKDFERRQACEAIAAIGPAAKGAIEDLLPLLEDDNEGVQDFAATALAAIGPAARAALEAQLDRDLPHVRMEAASALVALDPAHERATDVLLKSVTGVGNAELAARAQEIVVRQGASMSEPLGAYLDDPYPPVRLQVLQTLGKMAENGAAAQQRVARAVDDEKQEVRLQAIRTLAAIGVPAQIEPTFRRLIKDEDEEVATTAAMMLKHLGVQDGATGYEGMTDEQIAEQRAPSKEDEPKKKRRHKSGLRIKQR